MRSEDGYVTFTVFSLIIFIAAFIAGVSLYQFQGMRDLNYLEYNKAHEEYFMKITKDIITTILNDKSEGADSSFDDVWKVKDNDCKIILTETSSRLNPNFDNYDFWRKTGLNTRITSQYDFKEFESKRIKNFSSDKDQIKHIFQENDFENLYTLQSLINVNTAPFEVIEGFLRQNGYPENTISSFMSQIRKRKDQNISQEKLSGIIPVRNGKKTAVLAADSKINVNFADPLILEAVLRFPWNEKPLNNYLVIKNNILTARASRELTEGSLSSLLTVDQEIKKQLLLYLGTTSWTWHLELENDTHIFIVNFVRLATNNDKHDKIRIINKRLLQKELQKSS